MEFNNYMGKFTTSGEVQTAIDNGDLVKPYVALVGGEIDWNSKKTLKETPLTFEITSTGNIVWKTTNNDAVTIEYSKNGGEWTEITSTTAGVEIPVVSGDTIQFRGNNTKTRNSLFGDSTADYKVKGNIMSLLSKENFETLNTLQNFDDYTFTNLFSPAYYLYNNHLRDASKLILPATTLARSCYNSMFQRCTRLTTAPELPATTLADNCYSQMFNGCTSLATAPVLPATTLTTICYSGMFSGCTSLTTAPELPATTLTNFCYQRMFAGCTSLTTAPELPATNLVGWCYYYMFSGCSSLNYIKCLATDISANNCTGNWVSGVSSTGTFIKNPSMASWTEGENGIPSGWTIQDNV